MTAGESRGGSAAFNSLPSLCLCNYAGRVDIPRNWGPGGGSEMRVVSVPLTGCIALLLMFMIVPFKDAAKVLVNGRMSKGGPDLSLPVERKLFSVSCSVISNAL